MIVILRGLEALRDSRNSKFVLIDPAPYTSPIYRLRVVVCLRSLGSVRRTSHPSLSFLSITLPAAVQSYLRFQTLQSSFFSSI